MAIDRLSPLPPRFFPRTLELFESGGARLLPFMLITATGVFMASVSWLKWMHVIIDSGRELYVPWRISAGEMLYRDIPHLYGPLAHYVNALLFTLFGTSLRTLVVFNHLLIGALTWCLYGIFHRAFDRLAATLCGMTFLGAFAFSHAEEMGNWNFVAPYAHETTYGICLSFFMIPVLERSILRRNPFWAVFAGSLLGFVFLTKVEVFLASLLAAIVVISLPGSRTHSPGRIGLGKLLAALAGFCAPLLFFTALFAAGTTLAAALRMVATTATALGHSSILGNELYRWTSGLDAPFRNTALVFVTGTVYGVLYLGVMLLSKFVARRGGFNRHLFLLTAVIVAFGSFAYLTRTWIGWWIMPGRPFPLFVLAYIVLLMRRSGAGPAEDRDDRTVIPMVAVSVFSLVLLLKIVLRVHFLYYGFALAMPATLICVALAAHHLPRHVQRRGGCTVTAQVVVTALVIILLALQVENSRTFFRMMTYPVGSGGDRFMTYGPEFSERGPIVVDALTWIEAMVPKDAGFVAIPEGVMLNYLTRRRNPGKWFEFTPPFVETMGEERMRADLEAGRPEYVVLVERSTPEFGPEYFGVDYGFKLRDWITDHYTPIHLVGNKVFSSRGFGIAITQRQSQAR